MKLKVNHSIAFLIFYSTPLLADESIASCSEVLEKLRESSVNTIKYQEPVTSYSVPFNEMLHVMLGQLEWEPLPVSPINPSREQFAEFHGLSGDTIEAGACTTPAEDPVTPLTCTYILVREVLGERGFGGMVTIVVDELFASDCEPG